MDTTKINGIEIVRRFNDALNAADVNEMMALTTEDTVFENTSPAPDGERYSGKAQVRAFLGGFLSLIIFSQDRDRGNFCNGRSLRHALDIPLERQQWRNRTHPRRGCLSIKR